MLIGQKQFSRRIAVKRGNKRKRKRRNLIRIALAGGIDGIIATLATLPLRNGPIWHPAVIIDRRKVANRSSRHFSTRVCTRLRTRARTGEWCVSPLRLSNISFWHIETSRQSVTVISEREIGNVSRSLCLNRILFYQEKETKSMEISWKYFV